MAESVREHDKTEAKRTAALEQLEQELARGRARLAEQHTQRQAALREVKLARATASDLSWELADIEQRLHDLKEQREGPGDPLIDREIASLAVARAALEERVLAQMLLVDDLAARAGAEELALASAEQEWAAREASLIAERERIAEWIEILDPGDLS
jgi:hypothetical protein